MNFLQSIYVVSPSCQHDGSLLHAQFTGLIAPIPIALIVYQI